MSDCPTCGDSFDSTGGMKRHHALIHGESIAGEVVDCDSCGTPHRVKPHRLEDYDHHFCSDECKYDWHSEEYSGDGNPSWSGGKIEIECAVCGDCRTLYPSQVDRGKGQFCSQSCMTEYYRENSPTGEEHPRWEGGYDQYYGPSWAEMRKKVRERDNNTCQKCGATEDEQDRKADVHHIKPVRSFDEPGEAHTLDNMVQLCRSCHQQIEPLPEAKQRMIIN